MSQTWKPSDLGLRFTGSVPWTLHLSGDDVTLSAATRQLSASLSTSSPVVVRSGWFWASVRFTAAGQPSLEVDGLPNSQAAALAHALAARVQHHQQEEAKRKEAERRAARQREFFACLAVMEQFRVEVAADFERHDAEYRWFTTERVQEHEARRPALSTPAPMLEAWWSEPDIQATLGEAAREARTTLTWWRRLLTAHASDRNEVHLRNELRECQDLFDRVEKQPLTDEQRQAVVCMDSRVLTIAAAGSGKTSTMVAKAAYAVHRQLVPTDAIVLLAFNKDAAKELDERVQAAFARVGLSSEGITTLTFHKLGSDIIGAANQRKRRVAPWIENGDLAKLGELLRLLARV